MSLIATVRRWSQNNPQLATSLASMMVLGAFAAAGGDLANLSGSSWDPTGGTTVTSGP
ncbi:hypothetical protein G9C85_05465 [Halorubellus sp. JP-L1]|uniref:hypothetical protein n=1 Tax=Halorubellus sp. JP-L1 TaxID=2715753 RepID=UPI00140A128C|nr:hypothetical protein [Halorubellus sp. JP-L1]NHN41084.1 hypothetical protein [Halorubellus sp. JP-L1]